jgi:hypothetical protein
MVTAHLTETETRFLYDMSPMLSQHIQWDELFMSVSLCCYGIKHISITQLKEFLVAIAETAPYEALVLPAITTLACQRIRALKYMICSVIGAHRPLPMLAHLFQLYTCRRCEYDTDEFCDGAAAANNTAALGWLRDPDTGNGSYPWSESTCAVTARYGQLKALIWLRNPKTGGGVCPWCKESCFYLAQQYNYPAMTAWIDTQPDDD